MPSGIETTDIVVSTRANNFQKADALSDYRKKVKFIKVALDLSEKGMSSKKIQDLPTLMQRAEREITVGKMDTLLEGETIIETGFLRSIAGFFANLPGLKRPQRWQ